MSIQVGTADIRKDPTHDVSPEALMDLVSAKGSFEGARMGTGVPAERLRELTNAEMLGPGGGLTRRGAVTREIAVRRLESALFG